MASITIHTLKLERRYPSGAERMKCVDCDYEIIIQLRDENIKTIVLNPAEDPEAMHKYGQVTSTIEKTNIINLIDDLDLD